MQQSGLLRAGALCAVIVVIAAAGFLMLMPGEEKASIGENETDVSVVRQYTSATSSLTFTYPDSYVLTEHDAPGSAERAHHVIVLIDKKAAANIPENGEGPTTITIDIFGNGLDKQTPEQWIKNSSLSNFKLSPDQALSTSTVAGVHGLSYVWDGLYRGESTVIAHGTDIMMFSVTSMDSTDRIRDDFKTLLLSVQLR